MPLLLVLLVMTTVTSCDHHRFSYSVPKTATCSLFLEGQDATCHTGPWVKICCTVGCVPLAFVGISLVRLVDYLSDSCQN